MLSCSYVQDVSVSLNTNTFREPNTTVFSLREMYCFHIIMSSLSLVLLWLTLAHLCALMIVLWLTSARFCTPVIVPWLIFAHFCTLMIVLWLTFAHLCTLKSCWMAYISHILIFWASVFTQNMQLYASAKLWWPKVFAVELFVPYFTRSFVRSSVGSFARPPGYIFYKIIFCSFFIQSWECA